MASANELAISLPFRILPNGLVETSYDQAKIWADRVLAVVGTGIGERARMHSFGSEIYDQLFGTVDDAMAGIERGIEKAFMIHLPLLTYQGVEFDYNEYDNTLSVIVLYSLPNDEAAQTAIGTLSLNGTALYKESNG